MNIKFSTTLRLWARDHGKKTERYYWRSVWAGLTEHPDHLSLWLWIGTGPGSSETDWTPRSSPAEASYSDVTNMQSTVPQHQWLVTTITCSWCHWSSLTLSSARALSPFLSPSVSAVTQEIQNGTNKQTRKEEIKCVNVKKVCSWASTWCTQLNYHVPPLLVLTFFSTIILLLWLRLIILHHHLNRIRQNTVIHAR